MAANPLTDPTWAAELANTVERLVARVREQATDRAVTLVRAIVFGTIIGLMGIATVVLLIILGTRLLQRILTVFGWLDHPSAVWVSYLLMGGLLLIGGWWCMRKRTSPEARA